MMLRWLGGKLGRTRDQREGTLQGTATPAATPPSRDYNKPEPAGLGAEGDQLAKNHFAGLGLVQPVRYGEVYEV